MMQSSKKLDTIVRNFLKGEFELGLSLLMELQAHPISSNMQVIFNKLLSIYLLGQLVNLPTLHSILEQLGIKSNFYQISYNRLVKNISHQDFINLFEASFKETYFSLFIRFITSC